MLSIPQGYSSSKCGVILALCIHEFENRGSLWYIVFRRIIEVGNT